ncbi:helicase-related protein [Paenibacillus sp. WQ 127069]|uniref:Helicase-related protein n=1 Tax=Paenibacillus baimaensis TaxID=2982185 RepID=A0ABT2UFR2_9BACL|nr:helicase-related protein [Paenibacillus sp. WQ 127069]MCU6793470.1 helicase-related protein [Paenibacillus sp. WQ 127069]
MIICTEISVELTREERSEYALSEARAQARIAAEASSKVDIVRSLLSKHSDDKRVLVLGQNLNQLERIAQLVDAPLITGKMASPKRDKLYEQFRQGELRTLIVFKAAKSTIVIPDARVMIQVSGSFGSRKEESQQLVRHVYPESEGGNTYIYSVVTKDTKEQEYATQRQRLLREQGCEYTIIDAAVIAERHESTATLDAASLPYIKQGSPAWKALLPTLQAQTSMESPAAPQERGSNLLSLDDYRTRKRNRS